MGLNKIDELYYNGEQARKILGMTRDSFSYHVKVGDIQGVIVFGKQRKYEKKHIHMLASRISAAILAAQVPAIHFEQATLETLPKELELSERVWGEQTRAYHPYRQALLEKNPQMSYYLFDGEFLGASINIVPLSPEGIRRFKLGERGWLLGDYVVPYVPGKKHECIIIDMMSTPLAPMQQRMNYARMLFNGLSEVLEKWGSQGIEIMHVYANGGTTQGRHLLETAGFTRIGEFGARIIYEVAVENTDLQLLGPYQKALLRCKKK